MNADTHPKQKMSRTQKIIVGLVIAVAVLGVLGLYGVGRINSSGEQSEAFRASFLKSCTQGVLNAGGKTEFANGYCGCVYDDGVKRYGQQGLAEQATANGGLGTGGLREIATSCGERYKDFQG